VKAFVGTLSAVCTAVSCVASSAGASETTCVASVTAPDNVVLQAIYASSDCTGTPSLYYGVVNGGCISFVTTSAKFSCDGGVASYSVYATVGDCSGDATSTITQDLVDGQGCKAVAGVGSYLFQCSDAAHTKIWFFAIVLQLSLFIWRLF